jgi:hypothetical protein
MIDAARQLASRYGIDTSSSAYRLLPRISKKELQTAEEWRICRRDSSDNALRALKAVAMEQDEPDEEIIDAIRTIISHEEKLIAAQRNTVRNLFRPAREINHERVMNDELMARNEANFPHYALSAIPGPVRAIRAGGRIRVTACYGCSTDRSSRSDLCLRNRTDNWRCKRVQVLELPGRGEEVSEGIVLQRNPRRIGSVFPGHSVEWLEPDCHDQIELQADQTASELCLAGDGR